MGNTLKKFSDIYNEFIEYITFGIIDENNCIKVNGYDVNKLLKTTYLSPLGAYNYLIYLRENPKEALADLKKGLPRK